MIVALLMGLAAGTWWGSHRGSAPVRTARPAAQSVDAAAAAQELATVQRAEQIARLAAQELRKTLAEREEEISALRADLAFYSNLVGSGDEAQGLTVHGVQLTPVEGADAWLVTITLTRSARRPDENRGRVKMAVEGVRAGQLELLGWERLTTPDATDGLSYAFKYFQQLHTTIMLPADFTPTRLRVVVQPAGGQAMTHGLAWSEAVRATEVNDVQQQEGGER